MSVYNVTAVPNGNTQRASAFGNNPWTTSSTELHTALGQNAGAAWVIWSVYIPAANPNEILDAVRFRGSHKYTVAAGAGTRVVTAAAAYRTSVAAFTGADGVAIASRPGNGQSANVDFHLDASQFGSFNSNNLRDGSFFVGIFAHSGAGDAGWLTDVYDMGILQWTIYTSGSPPEPPDNQPYIILTPGAGNANPGKYAGIQQFASTRCDWVTNFTGPQQYLTFTWRITGPGITFAANGGQTLTINRGTTVDPVDWYWSVTGPLNIANNVKPGPYTLTCQVQSGSGKTFFESTQLFVQFPGNMTTEF